MRRWEIVAVAVLAILILGTFGYAVLTRKASVLTVATSAGAYSRAQASALFRPYGERTGIDMRIALYDGGIDDLRAQVAAKNYAWDVVDLELPDAVAACREGLLEHLDSTGLPAGANGAPAAADFVANAIGPCWVGSVVYSQAIAYAPQKFSSAKPATLGDVFDTARFPGPRALRRTSGKFNLELALLADGVAPKDIYPMLSTQQGVARALAKLELIRGSIVWWTHANEPAQMLQDGRAGFATILNDRIYDAIVRHQDLGAIWDRQLYELDVFAIPSGDPKKGMAADFIRFATSAQSLAHVADWVPYGPARRSALPLVTQNPELGIAMTRFLPTAPQNFATAFAVDDEWWGSHGPAIELQWQSWLAKTSANARKRHRAH